MIDMTHGPYGGSKRSGSKRPVNHNIVILITANRLAEFYFSSVLSDPLDYLQTLMEAENEIDLQAREN